MAQIVAGPSGPRRPASYKRAPGRQLAGLKRGRDIAGAWLRRGLCGVNPRGVPLILRAVDETQHRRSTAFSSEIGWGQEISDPEARVGRSPGAIVAGRRNHGVISGRGSGDADEARRSAMWPEGRIIQSHRIRHRFGTQAQQPATEIGEVPTIRDAGPPVHAAAARNGAGADRPKLSAAALVDRSSGESADTAADERARRPVPRDLAPEQPASERTNYQPARSITTAADTSSGPVGISVWLLIIVFAVVVGFAVAALFAGPAMMFPVSMIAVTPAGAVAVTPSMAIAIIRSVLIAPAIAVAPIAGLRVRRDRRGCGRERQGDDGKTLTEHIDLHSNRDAANATAYDPPVV